MNKNLSALLTIAILTGLLASQAAKAEGTDAQQGAGDKMAAEKNNCEGQKVEDKNSCKGKKEVKKVKKGYKNSCKNSCGESKDKKDETKKDQ